MKLDRHKMIIDLVERRTDNMELEDLVEYYEDKQTELLGSLSTPEIKKLYAEEIGDDE